MGGKALGDELPAKTLNFNIHVGHNVDRTLLVDTEITPLPRELDLSGARRDLYGCLDEGGGDGHRSAELLDHAHFRAPARDRKQPQVVHEAPHEEDAPTTGLEEILGCQWVFHGLGVEAFAVVEHTNGQLRGLGDRVKLKLDDDPFCLIFIIAMFDRVDHRFAHSNADPVHGVIIEVPDFSDVIAQDLNQIKHVEVTGKLQADRMPDFRHARLRYSAAVPHARVSGSSVG